MRLCLPRAVRYRLCDPPPIVKHPQCEDYVMSGAQACLMPTLNFIHTSPKVRIEWHVSLSACETAFLRNRAQAVQSNVTRILHTSLFSRRGCQSEARRQRGHFGPIQVVLMSCRLCLREHEPRNSGANTAEEVAHADASATVAR